VRHRRAGLLGGVYSAPLSDSRHANHTHTCPEPITHRVTDTNPHPEPYPVPHGKPYAHVQPDAVRQRDTDTNTWTVRYVLDRTAAASALAR
jgi:hypothetical protein